MNMPAHEPGEDPPGDILSPAMGRIQPDILVMDAMTKDPFTVPVHLPAPEAQALIERRRMNHILVTDRSSLRGIACVCDLWWTSASQSIGDVMSRALVTIVPWAPLHDAARIITQAGVGALPVVDGGNLLGILTRGDLVRAGHWKPDTVDRRCLLCGNHHHVRVVAGSATPILCVFCLGTRDPKEISQLLRARSDFAHSRQPVSC